MIQEILVSAFMKHEEREGKTHGANGDFLRDLLSLVDINLVEVDVGDLLRHLLEDRRDDTAGAAPGRPEVEDRDTVLADLNNTLRAIMRFPIQ
jgi:hypothetical protein